MTVFNSILIFSFTMTIINPIKVALGQKECNKEGLMCLDCDNLAVCQKTSTGFMISQVPCLATPCDDTVNACKSGGVCRYKEFQCPNNLDSFEFLPDPYSCTLYWQCGPNGINNQLACDPNLSYNPVSQTCDLSLMNNPLCINNPLPPCTYMGQNLTMPGTSYNYHCVFSNAGGYPTYFPELYPDSTGPITPFNCSNAGLFPYPGCCNKFYKCIRNTDGSFTQYVDLCRPGSHFQADSQKCVRGGCTSGVLCQL